MQVMNAGRPGYTIDESLAYLTEKGDRLRGAVVVLQIDIYSVALPDARSGLHFRDIAKQDQPPLGGTHYELKRFLREHSAIANMMNRFRSSLRVRKLVGKTAEAERTAENTGERRALNPDEGRRIYYAPNDPMSIPYWDKFEARMREFKDLADKNGIVLMALLFPAVEQLISQTYPATPQEKYAEVFRRLGIIHIDPLADLRAAGSVEAVTLLHHPVGPGDFKKPWKTVIGFPIPMEFTKSGDVHFSRYGNYLIAGAVADVLEREKRLVQGK